MFGKEAKQILADYGAYPTEKRNKLTQKKSHCLTDMSRTAKDDRRVTRMGLKPMTCRTGI